jgi:hypothetical protein
MKLVKSKSRNRLNDRSLESCKPLTGVLAPFKIKMKVLKVILIFFIALILIILSLRSLMWNFSGKRNMIFTVIAWLANHTQFLSLKICPLAKKGCSSLILMLSSHLQQQIKIAFMEKIRAD